MHFLKEGQKIWAWVDPPPYLGNAQKKTFFVLMSSLIRTIDFLMRHLHQMSLHSERTGMTSKNLAIVWSPNILRCDVSELDTQDALQVLDLVLGLFFLPTSIYLSLFEAGVEDHTSFMIKHPRQEHPKFVPQQNLC